MQKPQINRRVFLIGLVALGASISLSTPVEAATPAQIDKAWQELEENPWFFDVHDWTIVDVGVKPRVRADVFEDVSRGHSNPDYLIMDVEACPPLAWHLQWLAQKKLSEVVKELEVLRAPLDDNEDRDDLAKGAHVAYRPVGASTAEVVARRVALLRLQQALADPDDGWKEWVTLEGAVGLPSFHRVIDEWLKKPISSTDWDYVLQSNTPSRAYGFFARTEPEILDALGIVVVEGEHPGSTYYAAELRGPIDAANAAAKELGLPFRFR
jgi:hypothetical protein